MGRQGKFGASLHSKFVGRDKETTEVKGHLEESMRGNGRLVIIVGETGIGKSRLLEELGKYAESKGVLYLRGRCLYQENAEPYLPFTEAFGKYLAESQGFGEINLMMDAAGTSEEPLALGLLPLDRDDDTSRSYRGLNLQEERDRLFESLYKLVIDLSEKKPMLLVLDDVQWADDSSLQLLHYLARNLRNTKVMMCAAYCPEDLKNMGSRPHPLSETIRRMRIEKLFFEISLGRFDEELTTLMIESLVGKEGLPKEFTKKLYDESEGNPFFIEEVVRSLVNEGLIDVDSYRWDARIDTSEIRIPGTIRDVIARRIDSLDDRTKNLLKHASIIGNSFAFDVLHRISDVGEEKVIDAIDASIAANIIHEDAGSKEERYKFDHTLIREVIYNSMSRSRRRMMHKRIGNIIEELNRDRINEVVYSLAHHFNEGRDTDKTLIYAIKAGEKSLKTYAPEDSIKFYRIALFTLEEMESNEENMAKKLIVVGKLGEIHNLIGEWDVSLGYHKYALELGEKLGGDIERAKAYRAMGHIKQNQGEFDAALENFEKGLEISAEMDDIHGMADTYRGMGRVFWRKGKFEKAIVYFQQSLNLTKRIEDKKIMAVTCIELGNVYSELSDWGKAIEYQRNSLRLLEKIQDFYEMGRGYNNIGVTFARKGDINNAIEHYEKSLEFSDKTGNVRMVGWALFNAGEAYARIGKFEQALEYCDKSLSIFERLDEKVGISGAYMSYGIIYKLKKQWDRAIQYFEKSMQIREELEMPYRLADGYYEFGLLYREKGDRTKAQECFVKAGEIFRDLGANESLEKVEGELKSINDMKYFGEI